MRYIAVVAVALLAGACNSPGSLFSNSQQVCADMGFVNGTQEYATCVFNNERLKAERRAGLSAAGASLQQMGEPTYAPRRMITCTQHGAVTNCW